MTAPVLIGTRGLTGRACVDRGGALTPVDAGHVLSWWVGADDRWRDPLDDPTVRQRRWSGAPVVETRVRVPGGDVVQLAYAVGDRAISRFANESPAPVALALDLGAARAGSARRIEVARETVRVDDRAVLRLPRAPQRWAAATSRTARIEIVCAGGALEAPAAAVEDRAGNAGMTLLVPLAHRAETSVSLRLGVEGPRDEREDPGPEAVVRGWRAQLDAAARLQLPEPWQELADAARATLLLERIGRRTPPASIAAFEDWGFDDEAIAAWARATMLARRRARRARPVATGDELAHALDAAQLAASEVATWERGPAGFLLALRAVLAREHADGIEVMRAVPTGWLGADLEVHELPSSCGPVGFAVRWHGERPALLWEVPEGTVVRAPGLDPAWSSGAPRGEALLGPVPAR